MPFQLYEKLIKPLYFDLRDFVLNILFPIRCVICEKEGKSAPCFQDEEKNRQMDNGQKDQKNQNIEKPKSAGFLCTDCQNKLTPLPLQYCIACQKPSPFGLTHTNCRSPHTADALISIFDYHDEKVGKIIIAGKYKFIPAIFEILGQLAAKKLADDYPQLLTIPYTLTPTPLHPFRKRWRGFNQAEILCNIIGNELTLSSTTVLVRCKLTMTQKNLKKEARGKNVEGAFALQSKISNLKSTINNKNFILVDDVTTTGATLAEAARVLKQSGANKVLCLTVARD